MKYQETIQTIERSGVVAIIRTKTDLYAEITACIPALESAGLQAIEVTMNTPRALQMLTWGRENLKAGSLLGAGTVVTVDDAKAAIDAGAQFLVAPTLSLPVIEEALKQKIPIAPGCFTPTEALTAHQAGAPFVKIFPCMDPNHIKAMLAPLPQLKLIPTGGVNEKNCGDFIRAGAVAVGIGSAIFSDDKLRRKDFATIASQAAAIAKSVSAAKAER